MEYDEKFLEDTITGLKDHIKDLFMWSAYNKDEFNEEIAEIQLAIDKLETLKHKREGRDLV